MKRDMDLVRNILLAIEAEPTGYAPEKLVIEGYTKDQIGYHVFIMIEAGLIEGQDVTSMGSSCPVGVATRMTWHGHEFLDACRDLTRWNKAKGIVAKIGGATIEVFKQVLTELMVNQAKQAIS